jgi:hypothetical protein
MWLAIFTINLLPMSVAPFSMVVRCKFAETDKHLKNFERESISQIANRESLSRRIERAESVEAD